MATLSDSALEAIRAERERRPDYKVVFRCKRCRVVCVNGSCKCCLASIYPADLGDGGKGHEPLCSVDEALADSMT